MATPIGLLGAEERVGVATKQNSARDKAAIACELDMLLRAIDSVHGWMSNIEEAVRPISAPLSPVDGPQTHDQIGTSDIYGILHGAVTSLHGLQERMATVVRSLEV